MYPPDWFLQIISIFALLVVLPYATWTQSPQLVPTMTLVFRMMGLLVISLWVLSMLFRLREKAWKTDLRGTIELMKYATPDMMSHMLRPE